MHTIGGWNGINKYKTLPILPVRATLYQELDIGNGEVKPKLSGLKSLGKLFNSETILC